MAAVQWRYYLVFVICNFTNAVFFWLFLPETKQVPLEEMNFLFTHAPWLIPGTDKATYRANYQAEINQRAIEIGEKMNAHNVHDEKVQDSH